VKAYSAIIRSVSIVFALKLALCVIAGAQETAISADVHASLEDAAPAPLLFDAAVHEDARTTTTTMVTAKTPPKPTINDDIADGKWHIFNTGYTWLPSVHGTAGIAGYNTGLHITAFDLVKNATFAIQDLFEPQYKHVSVPTDFIWMRLNDSVPISFAPNYTFNAKATLAIFTPKLAVLVVNEPTLKIYGTAGLRYWHLGLTETLTPPLTTGAGLYQAANWVDFDGGVRSVMTLSRKASFTMAGDAGKGGANLDYQVAGLLDYQIDKIFKWEMKKRVVAELGWRYMVVHYQGGRQFVFDPAMSGPVIAFTTRYK
jgi:hypothetical protein